MIDFIIIDNCIIRGDFKYEIISFYKSDDKYVDVDSVNSLGGVYNTSLGANECSINGIPQTSADMIFETLSNGQS
jgi:hypothetical protein